jgi:hypothetical protein
MKVLNLYYGGPRIKRVLQRRLSRKCAEKLRVDDEEIFACIQATIVNRHGSDSLSEGKYSDSMFLYEQILERKPRLVLECGTGISSIAMAYAMKKVSEETGQVCKLVSVEEHTSYLEKFVLPDFPPDLKKYCEFFVRETSFSYFTNGKKEYVGIHFSDVPKGDYDLMYIDGPAYLHKEHYVGSPSTKLREVREKIGRPFDSDCIQIAKELRKEIPIIIDQRIQTRWAILDLASSVISRKYYPLYGKSLIIIDGKSFKDLQIRPVE